MQHLAVRKQPAHEDGKRDSVAMRTDEKGDEVIRVPTSDSSRASKSGVPSSQHENAKSWKASKTRRKSNIVKSPESSQDKEASPVPAEAAHAMERAIGLYVPVLPSIHRELVYVIGWPKTYVSTLFRVIVIFTAYLADDIVFCFRSIYLTSFGRQNITRPLVTPYRSCKNPAGIY